MEHPWSKLELVVTYIIVDIVYSCSLFLEVTKTKQMQFVAMLPKNCRIDITISHVLFCFCPSGDRESQQKWKNGSFFSHAVHPAGRWGATERSRSTFYQSPCLSIRRPFWKLFSVTWDQACNDVKRSINKKLILKAVSNKDLKWRKNVCEAWNNICSSYCAYFLLLFYTAVISVLTKLISLYIQKQHLWWGLVFTELYFPELLLLL